MKLAAAGVTTQPSAIVSGQRGKKKIDTYRAVFTGDVVIEQIEGMKPIGKLEADRLEINLISARSRRASLPPSDRAMPHLRARHRRMARRPRMN